MAACRNCTLLTMKPLCAWSVTALESHTVTRRWTGVLHVFAVYIGRLVTHCYFKLSEFCQILRLKILWRFRNVLTPHWTFLAPPPVTICLLTTNVAVWFWGRLTVCLSVCLAVCLTITCKILNVESSFLVRGYASFTEFLGSYVKVTRSRSKSHEQKKRICDYFSDYKFRTSLPTNFMFDTLELFMGWVDP